MSTDAKAGNRNIRRGDAKLAAVSRVPQRWDILRAGVAERELMEVTSARKKILEGKLTSLLPRPKPLIIEPERRIGKGGAGPVGGPAIGERERVESIWRGGRGRIEEFGWRWEE